MRDVPADPALVVKGGWTIAGGHAAFLRLRQLPDPPTAAFCFCDRTAVGVYNAAGELGLRIPQDISVVGFDNEAFTADMLPPLTTMELPHADMACHAVEELHRMMAQPGTRPRHPRMKFDCPLIARLSVGSLAGAARRVAVARG
jgi:LacI family transcriptional regulator